MLKALQELFKNVDLCIMKLQRFYVVVQRLSRRLPVTIPSLDLRQQMERVLRFAPGDKVILFDGSGKDFTASINAYQADGVSFSILEEMENNVKAAREIWLFASVIKKDNFEWIVEKATELGVSHIVPVISERSEKKNINMERLEKISIEASEQSGRATIPTIHTIMKLSESFDLIKKENLNAIVFHTEGERFKKEDKREKLGGGAVAAFIGPEGGWSPEEIALFHKEGITVRNLGPQILRAETAVVAALSQLVF
jgi:16S rRNA (uracil1498-N3)-methyltransferase